MNFQDLLRQDARYLLDPRGNGHAETITRYPLGDRTKAEPLSAIVCLEEEEGTNQVSGDGPEPNDQHGERERRTGTLEVSAEVKIDDRDTFLIYDELWCVKRGRGRDRALQSIRIVRAEGRLTKRPRLRSTGRGGR